MEGEQKFVIWLVVGMLLLALIGMGGCDYWPPALQAHIEELQTELHNALDENQRLDRELKELKATGVSIQHELDDHVPAGQGDRERVEFSAMASSDRPQALSAEGGQVSVEPLGSSVARGSYVSLRLEQPHRQGERIVMLQRLLRRHHIPIRIDGIYGPDTDRAVRQFQRLQGLPADGIVGPATYRVLRRTAPTSTLVRHVKFQRPLLTGPDVSRLQRALRRKGYRLPIDGQFGHKTKTAVLRFQRSRGLRPDGIVGPQTWAALRTAQ